jgi:Predicted membrane-associated HD superfamily hydrolase
VIDTLSNDIRLKDSIAYTEELARCIADSLAKQAKDSSGIKLDRQTVNEKQHKVNFGVENIVDYVKNHGVVISFILLIVALVLKLQKKKNLYWIICILSLLAIVVFLFNISNLKLVSDYIWWYKASFGFMILLLIVDFVLAIRFKRSVISK